jgi:dipeptidyl aminopeptidase/acylaminoacyl peptidase
MVSPASVAYSFIFWYGGDMNVRALPVLLAFPLFACADEPPPAPATPPPAPPPVAAPPPPVAHAPRAPVALDEYFKIRRMTGLSFSFDEKLVAFMSDAGGRPDVWVRPIADGPATQVTHVDGFVHSFAFSPGADQLEVEADHGGDELPHLYLTSSKGEPLKDLTPDLPAGRRTQFVRWSDDGKKILFLSSARDEKALDLYEYDVKAGKAARLWESDGKLGFALASRDHSRFIVIDTHDDSNNDLYLVERANPKKRVLITEHKGSILHQPAYFSRDKKTLYLTSDATGEFAALEALNLATNKMTSVLMTSWDVDGADESFAGKYSFTVTNSDGTSQLVVTDNKTHAPVALPPPPRGGAWDPIDHTRSNDFFLGTSKSDRYLGVRLHSDAAPSVPYIIDLQNGTATKVAEPLPDTMKSLAMLPGTSVRIKSFDGKLVPAYVYSPPGQGPFPAIIDVHGGPTAQSHRDFNRTRQYFVSKGYVVLVPNVRGSTGYGKSWTRLDNMDLGGGPLKDVVACKQYLVDNAHVDPEKVVVMGGSYGGYMALAAEAFTPTEFAANVDYFGVSDLKSLVQSFPPYWASAASFIYMKFGNPSEPADAAYQHDRSPLNFVDKMQRPLLVVQGEKDARVKADQSERIVSALKAKNVPVHYLLLPGEGHGFTKNENTLKATLLTDRFLDRYVWGDTSVTVD